MSVARDEFDLRIRVEDDGQVRVSASCEDGDASGDFRLRSDHATLLENFGPDQTQDDREKLRRVVGAAMFPGQVRPLFGNWVGALAGRAGAVRIREAGSEAPLIPWELARLRAVNTQPFQSLTSIAGLAVVRHLDIPQRLRSPVCEGTPRTLLVSAMEFGDEDLREILRGWTPQAIGPRSSADAVLAGLQHNYDIVHIATHGATDGSGLCFATNAAGDIKILQQAQLASSAAIRDAKLVILAACHTAGVARALAAGGAAAVVGWHDAVETDDVQAVVREFVRRVAVGEPIQAALGVSYREHVERGGSLSDLATPVLFMRSQDCGLVGRAAPRSAKRGPSIAVKESSDAAAPVVLVVDDEDAADIAGQLGASFWFLIATTEAEGREYLESSQRIDVGVFDMMIDSDSADGGRGLLELCNTRRPELPKLVVSSDPQLGGNEFTPDAFYARFEVATIFWKPVSGPVLGLNEAIEALLSRPVVDVVTAQIERHANEVARAIRSQRPEDLNLQLDAIEDAADEAKESAARADAAGAANRRVWRIYEHFVAAHEVH